MLQNARVTEFTVSELLRDNQQAVKLPPPHQNKGYSSRSAASSGTEIAGASISDILSMVSWSNESVWQKYYNKPVLKPEASFQRKLL